MELYMHTKMIIKILFNWHLNSLTKETLINKKVKIVSKKYIEILK